MNRLSTAPRNLLWLLLLLAPAGVSAQDGGVADAGTPQKPVDEAPKPAAAPRGQELVRVTTENLRLRKRRLERALTANPALDVSLATLFTLDLADDSAVAQRVRQLDAQIAQLRSDKSLDLARVRTSSTSTVTFDPELVKQKLVLETTILERKFLVQDRATRLARVRANAARDALALENSEAEARQRIADEEARQAEAERTRALEEAQAARTANLKRIKNQRAAVAHAMGELATKEKELGHRRTERNKARQGAFTNAQTLLLRIERSTSATAAPALLERTDRALTNALDTLEAALTEYRAGFDAPELTLGERPDIANASEEEEAALEELDAAERAYATYAREIAERQSSALLLSVSAWSKQVVALDQARNRVLSQLSQRSQRALFSFSQRALEEARLELRSIALRTVSRSLLLTDDIVHIRRAVLDLMTLGRTFWAFLKLALIVLAALWLRSRGPAMAAAFEENVVAKTRSIVWIHRLRFLQRFFERFGRSLLFIVTLHVIEWALGEPEEETLLDLVFTVVFWLSYYWFLRKVLRVALIWALRRGPLPLGPGDRTRVEESVFLVGRTFFATGLFLSLAAQILGPGVLYHAARALLFVVVVAVAFSLLRRWREAIVAAYLARWPEGTIARLVESTRGKFYGIFVVLAAFVVVVARTAYAGIKRTTLSFEHSRRALAFVFKKRLERRNDEFGAWEARIEALPPRLVEAFTDAPTDVPELKIDHYPGIDALVVALDQWKSGRAKGSFLLRGSRGYGKTTWIDRALTEFEDLPHNVLALTRADESVPALVARLAEAADVEPTEDPKELVERLVAGPRRVIVLDDLQNIVLRTYDGYRTLEQLMQLIELTGHHVFWLATVHQLLWHQVCAAHPRRLRFRHEHELRAWSEEEIRQLVLSRAAVASVEHLFEDVLVDASDTSAEAMNRAVEAYTRLIWDAADGNPRVSLYFWLRSLAPVDDKSVRVRLFREPDVDDLELLPDEMKFIYSAVASHQSLSAAEVAAILRYPEPLCEAHLVRGLEIGHLEVDEARQRYALALFWERTTVRFLRRKRVL